MSRQVTLRPNGLAFSSGSWNLIGSGSANAATSDDNDGTYFYFIGSGGEVGLHFGTYTLASNERCAAARLVHRLKGSGFGDFSLDTWIRGSGFGDGGGGWYYGGDLPNWTTFWNDYYWRDYTQAQIDSLEGHYRNNASGITTASVAESYIDLLIYTQPTVAITGPYAGERVVSQTPTIFWNYNNQGDTIRSHQVKVFTAAVVTGGGFDPNTSSAVYDSGVVGGAATSKTINVALSYGASYYAYVRTSTDYFAADYWSNWASVQFFINSPPTVTSVTVTPTTPITTTNRPTIGWTYNDVDGNWQQAYYIRIYPESVYSVGGFDPNISGDSGAAWSSGSVAHIVTAGSTDSAQSAALSPNVNYKAYVWVSDIGTAGRWSSPVASTVFTIQTAAGLITDPPAVPEVTGVLADQANQRVVVNLQGRDNLLTRNQASVDTGIVGWQNVANGTLSRETTTTLQGGAALRQTTTWTTGGALDMTARSGPGGQSGFAVTPGRTYTGLGSSRAAQATTRSTRVDIRWYDSAGATISTISGTASANAQGSWGPRSVTAVAPANAAYADLLLVVVGTATVSEAHLWDNMSLAPGSSTTWTRGGLISDPGQLADTFTRADSATTLGTAETGGAWSALAGTWGISGNKAYMPAGATDGFAVLTSNFLSDGYAEADITLSATANRAATGLVFRAADINNMLMVELTKVVGADIIGLWKRIGGTWTQLAAITSAGLVNGTTYKVRAEFYGGQILIYVDGALKLSYLMLAGDLTSLGGNSKYGFRLNSTGSTNDDVGSRFDNFKAGAARVGQIITLQRSLDGGTTWTNVRGAVDKAYNDQLGLVYDYEVPPNVLARYRAMSEAGEAGTDYDSAWSAAVVQNAILTVAEWWLKDPLDPTVNAKVNVSPPFRFTRAEPQQAYQPLGRSTAVVVTDGQKGIEGELNLWAKSKAEYDVLNALLAKSHVLLLTDPLGRQWYVKFGDSQDWELVRAQPAAGETTPIRYLHSVRLPFVEVAAPAVT